MSRAAFLVAAVLLAAAPAWGYSVDAITAKGWPGVAGKFAVVPAICPAGFDCASFNEAVGEYLAEMEPPLDYVGSETVAQALMDTGTDRLTDENRAPLAESLGVQSFFVVIVGNSEVESSGAFVTTVGRSALVTPNSVGHGGLEVRVVSPDGKLLAKGTGSGTSSWRTGNRLINALFEDVLYRLFPEE